MINPDMENDLRSAQSANAEILRVLDAAMTMAYETEHNLTRLERRLLERELERENNEEN